MLVVTGRKAQDRQREGNYLHIGIATRAFERRFELADFVRVESADMKDGLLSIELVREIPEAMKPRKIEIRGSESRTLEGTAQRSDGEHAPQPRHEPEVERETA
jgi:molecular chaperone IbpA